jgi:O-antigen/teichoic acid export membrane protein
MTTARLHSHPGRHLLDGTLWVILAEALFPVTGLLTAAFLTRSLGPDGYGLLTLAVTLVGLAEWSINSFFSRATIKHVGESTDWRPLGTVAVQLQFRMGIWAMAAMWMLALPFARVLNEPSLVAYLALMAVDIPLFALAQAHRHVLAGTGAYQECALASATRWLARLVFVIFLVAVGLSVFGVMLAIIGSTLLELRLYRRTLRPALFSRAALKSWSLWNYSWPSFLSAVCVTAVGRMDLFAVKALGATVEEAGLYGAAQNLALVPALLSMSAAPLLLSSVSRALSNGDAGLARMMTRQAMRGVLPLFPLAAMIAGSAGEIAVCLFGVSFQGSGRFLPALIFGTVATLPLSVALTVLIADGKPRMTYVLTGPLVPLALLGHVVIIPRYGPFGASLVTASVAFIGMLIGLVTVGRLWGVMPPLGTVVRTLVVSLLALAAAMTWPTSGLFVFVKLFVLTGLVVACYWALQEFTGEEMALVRSLAMGTGTAMRSTNNAEGVSEADPTMQENARPGWTVRGRNPTGF